MSKRKTVRSGVREIEISPVSIYGEVYTVNKARVKLCHQYVH